MEGVIYAQSCVGNAITVKAVPAQGYLFAADAVTEWVFEVPAVEEPANPAEPDDSDELAKTGISSILGAIAGAFTFVGTLFKRLSGRFWVF